jgi:hypothetical protein
MHAKGGIKGRTCTLLQIPLCAASIAKAERAAPTCTFSSGMLGLLPAAISDGLASWPSSSGSTPPNSSLLSPAAAAAPAGASPPSAAAAASAGVLPSSAALLLLAAPPLLLLLLLGMGTSASSLKVLVKSAPLRSMSDSRSAMSESSSTAASCSRGAAAAAAAAAASTAGLAERLMGQTGRSLLLPGPAAAAAGLGVAAAAEEDAAPSPAAAAAAAPAAPTRPNLRLNRERYALQAACQQRQQPVCQRESKMMMCYQHFVGTT